MHQVTTPREEQPLSTAAALLAEVVELRASNEQLGRALASPLQGCAHQRRGFEIDLTGQGDQCPFPSVMAVHGELWEGHDASVRKTIRQQARRRRSPGLPGRAVGRGVRSAEAGQRLVRQPAQQDSEPTQFPPGMRRVADARSARSSDLCSVTACRRGLGRLRSSVVLASCEGRSEAARSQDMDGTRARVGSPRSPQRSART